jgi:hypothetical protein
LQHAAAVVDKDDALACSGPQPISILAKCLDVPVMPTGRDGDRHLDANQHDVVLNNLTGNQLRLKIDEQMRPGQLAQQR